VIDLVRHFADPWRDLAHFDERAKTKLLQRPFYLGGHLLPPLKVSLLQGNKGLAVRLDKAQAY
jgi:hypothetical protein